MGTDFIIQSILVYGLTALILYTLGMQFSDVNRHLNSSIKVNYIKGKTFLFWIAVVFATVSGLRYLTGSDTISYVEKYHLLEKNHNYVDEHFEIGWTYFCKILVILGFNANAYLFVVALIQISAFLYFFKSKPLILPYLVLTLIISGEFLNLWNGLRQVTVAYLFFPLLLAVEKKRYVLFLLAVVLLSFWHKSSYLLLFFYPLFHYGKDFFIDKKFQFVIWVVCLYVGSNSIWIGLIDYISLGADWLGYEQTQESMINYMESLDKRNFGFRSLSIFSMFAITMFYSDKIIAYFKNDRHISFFYNSFLLFVYSEALFSNARILVRVYYYAQPFVFVMYSYLLYYLFHSNRNSNIIIGVVIITMLSLSLLASITTAVGDGSALYKCVLWN